MKEIFIRQFRFEKCTSDKREYNVIMPYTAIHYITDGYGYFNGKHLGKGQYFCTFEDQKSTWYPDRETPWSYYFADLCGREAMEVIKKYNLTEDGGCGFFDSYDELQLLYKLYNLKASGKNVSTEFLTSTAHTLLSLHRVSAKNQGLPESVRIVNEVKNYINHNYHRKIKIEDIASDLFLSRGYIRNVFFENTGMAPKAYLQNVRFEAACNLLKNTGYTVAEISASVGYDDQLNFSKLFRKKYGISPSNYRKEI